METQKKIIVFNTYSRLLEPCLHTVSKKFPDALIVVLNTSGSSIESINAPHNNVIRTKNNSFNYSEINQLLADNYTEYIFLYPSKKLYKYSNIIRMIEKITGENNSPIYGYNNFNRLLEFEPGKRRTVKIQSITQPGVTFFNNSLFLLERILLFPLALVKGGSAWKKSGELAKILNYNLKYLLVSAKNGVFLNWFLSNKALKKNCSPTLFQSDNKEINNPEELKLFLTKNDIYYNEGAHTVYLPPQNNLSRFIKEIAGKYPKNTGFKILKNFQPPEKANYITHGEKHYIRKKLIGSNFELLRAANFLYINDIGDRLWDLIHLKLHNTDLTIFAVEHVPDNQPTQQDYEIFKEKLERLLTSKKISLCYFYNEFPEFDDDPDFQGPNCEGNLLIDDNNKPRYIDFQNFVIRKPEKRIKELLREAKDVFHFGGERLYRGGKHLYQSVPGIKSNAKRDTLTRWNTMNEQFEELGLEFKDKVVLDIGCNAGIFLHHALSKGAWWTLGWDRPEIIPYSEKLLLLLGNSRFHMFGRDLSESYNLYDDIPDHLSSELDGSIIFYLAMSKHIGVNKTIYDIPWQYLVLEGHQSDTLPGFKQQLDELLTAKNATILHESMMRDGDSKPRPFLIVKSQNP